MSEMSLRFKLVCGAVATFMTVAWVVAESAPPATHVNPAGTTIVGESLRLGNAKAHSWVRLDDGGVPAGVGVTLGEASLESIEDNKIVIEFPRGVAPPPFDHVTFISATTDDGAPLILANFSTLTRLEQSQTRTATRSRASAAALRYFTRGGNLASIEQAIPRSMLDTRASVTQPIAPLRIYPAGYFPGACSIRYDAAAHEYTISLEDLTRHEHK